MELIEVKGSAIIRGYSYDAEARTLRVVFSQGRAWTYQDVPQEVVDEVFVDAESVGSAFHARVKNIYAGKDSTGRDRKTAREAKRAEAGTGGDSPTPSRKRTTKKASRRAGGRK